MANVVVAIYNPLMRQNGLYPYFETMLNGLKDAGNNVLCFQKVAVEIEGANQIPSKYLEKIKEFNPDLFILVNNQFWDISKYFDVPILIYDVDSPNVYMNINNLKNNINRYKYLCITKSGVDIIHDVIGCDYSKIRYIPPYTGVNADKNIPQKLNIAFCGSHWMWNDFKQVENFLSKKPSDEERMYAMQIYKKYLQQPFNTSKELYSELNIDIDKKLDFDNLYLWSVRISGLKRLRCLLEIVDLGLEIRGYMWNLTNSTPLKTFPELLLSYSDSVINDVQSTQDFYNSAKIGFNTTHIQAKTGFGWRVADILASNACLVTEYSEDLKDLGFDIPTYKNPIEAKSLCEKLLVDDTYRQSIVDKCHKIIDKNHRFIHVLPIIEDVAGLSLRSNNMGTLEFISTEMNTVKAEKNLKLKDKFRLKIYKHLEKNLKRKQII